MNSICILLTDHESINEEIIIQSYKDLLTVRVSKIYFIGSKKNFKKIYTKFKKKKKFEFIDVEVKKKDFFKYLKSITSKALELCNNKKNTFILNMPLNKKKFLKNKFPGFTEFFSYSIDKKKDENMLLYNEKSFSVCPLTTHIELQNVTNKISERKIKNCINNVIDFYKIINKKVTIVVLGLNPHASIDFKKNVKDKNLIGRIIKKMKKKRINILGPISADTAFIENYKNKVFIGMYHDQVLIPFKTINKFDGINITIGKKILRLSPDHGTAKNLRGRKKTISNQSFLKCIEFCSKKLNV
tara:strand:+ start:2620 stop:3519 length:900 start_codon:yes stop_codon:yes gene_type:complete